MPENNGSGHEEETAKKSSRIESSRTAPEFPELETTDEIPRRLVEFYRGRVMELIRRGYAPQAAKERAMNLITRSNSTYPTIDEFPVHDELNKRQEVLSNQIGARRETQKMEIMEALETGGINPHAHYHDPEPWAKVESESLYQTRQKDIDILKRSENLKSIIECLADRNTEYLHIADLGPGTGRKTIQIIDKLLKYYPLDLELVDVSPEMLFKTVASLFDKIAWHIRERLARGEVGESNPWKEFIEFARNHELALTQRPTDAALKIEKIFYKYLAGELYRHDEKMKAASLGKFILGRKFSLHRPHDVPLFDELDEEVELPLEVYPNKKTFEKLKSSEFENPDNCATLFMQLGNVICNSHPENTIRDLLAKNLLDKPEVKGDEKNPREQDIKANYALVSFHLGKFDKPDVPEGKLNKEAKKILEGYTTPAAIHFCSHLFTDPELTTFLRPGPKTIREEGFIDPDDDRESKGELKREDCFDIVTTYEEDPDHPGYYGKIHRLVFKRNVKIKIKKYDKNLDEGVNYYYEKKKGEEILLLPSYTPTLSQMRQLCKKHGLQIVKTLKDDDKKPTTAVLLLRGMTEREKKNSGLFQVINSDPDILNKESDK